MINTTTAENRLVLSKGRIIDRMIYLLNKQSIKDQKNYMIHTTNINII
jgi:hypothetical protein